MGGKTLPVKMNISKLCTVRARCVQLPLGRKLSVKPFQRVNYTSELLAVHIPWKLRACIVCVRR